jgi:recombinational DNA repair ATPase RecF
MRIQRLDIENFRGIREMQIELHPHLNVFAGKNGVGKTTILEALDKTLGSTN